MNKLKVGMIGVGGFGGYRREQLRQSGRFDLVAVTDRDPGTLARVAQEDHAKACANFDELLRVPGLEGIVISTGADSHATLSLAAMKAGLHVFVEKPLCASVAEVQACCMSFRIAVAQSLCLPGDVTDNLDRDGPAWNDQWQVR